MGYSGERRGAWKCGTVFLARKLASKLAVWLAHFEMIRLLINRKSGFTLVEVLVAMFILVIFLVIIFDIFPVTRHALQLSENHVNAAFLGSSLLEEARTAGLSNIVATSGSRTFTGTDNGNPFTQTINYTVNVQSLDVDKKRVWVTCAWHEWSGNKQVILETTIVDPTIKVGL